MTAVKGTSISQFFESFSDEQACLEQIVSAKWGNHSPCPGCGELGQWFPVRNSKKYRHSCNLQFSPLKDTVIYRSNLSLIAFFYALLLFCNSAYGMRSSFIRKQLGIGVKSAHRLCNRVRLHMSAYNRASKLGGKGKTVYVDEVYLRRIVDLQSSRRKGAFVQGLRCDGQLLMGIVADRKRRSLVDNIERLVLPGSRIITDSYGSYRALGDKGWEHIRINHSRAFHDFHGHTTNPIECCWSALKRNLKSYSQVGEHNLWLFLAEFECRFNLRSETTSCFEQLCSHFPPINEETQLALIKRFDWRSLDSSFKA
ncbi:IS1595 family transposase [Erythrobacter ani]|uniref:IS1595 family transposase n=1 Tax=Erythrobacter ani TaxID=2827235 RepID=A0ABS6SR96_9SPHN|nr:IS1595 family transposase [Erythrobacter ani]